MALKRELSALILVEGFSLKKMETWNWGYLNDYQLLIAGSMRNEIF